MRAYCQLAGLQLLELIREEGVSGAKPLGQRPGGKALAALIERGRVNHIVALKLDRLFRDAADCLGQTREWDHGGVALHLVDLGGQTLNTASAMGRLFLTMTAAFAELERNLIAERTTLALAHKKAHRRAYSPTPMGYQRDGDALVRDEGEQGTVQRIRAWRDDGWGFGRIARALNDEGLPAKRGGRWYRSTVAYLLGNSLYEDDAGGA